VECIVFEKDDALHAKSRDWNMGLHWGAPSLKRVLSEEAWNRLQTVQVDPNVPPKPNDTLKFLDSSTGEVIGGATVDLFHRLRRSKLRDLLAEGIDVRFGKKFSSAEFDDEAGLVTARFSDDTTAGGSMLVGADGGKSSVRRSLLPETGTEYVNKRLPYAATFVQASFTREQAIFLRSFHPLYLAGIHPDGQFSFFGMQDASDASRPESWIFFFYISWRSEIDSEQDASADWENAQRLQQVKEFAKAYADPWKSAFAWLADDHPVWYMGLSEWDPGLDGHRWNNHNGLATLIGDAAHGMTYQRGQGLNHSMTDSAKLLTTVLSKPQADGAGADAAAGRREAVEAFEAEMIERAGAEVRMSTKNTVMLHDWELALQSPLMTKGMHGSRK
jgi:2-polyprenyl-6-methoxyphenol hydroxylase-like FAD-dependent oxidoreductase